MDINEIAKKKLKLEEDLRNLILTFEKETTCTIDDIEYNRVFTLGEDSRNCPSKVTTKVLL